VSGPISPCPKTASRIDLGVPGRDRRTSHTLTMDATTALAIYRAEKDKALRERRVSHVQLMAEAQEAFRKMLADAQLARKGGRPKGSTNSTPPAVTAVAAAPVVPPGKLVLKKTKSAAPTKQPEKVTIAAAARAPMAKAEKAVKPARPSKASKPAAKSKPAKAAAPVEKRVRAKAAHKAAASPRKGAAKKTSPTRKQAAARERRPKNHKR
jgi:hypothetical protein